MYAISARLHHIRGFTLVELTVIIVVISILSSIIVLSYGSIQKESRDQKREADIHMMRSALERYYGEHGEYPAGTALNVSDRALPEDAITGASSISDIQQFLPTIPAEINDPLYKRSDGIYLFTNGSIDTRYTDAYFYMGSWTSLVGKGLGGAMYFYDKEGNLQECNYGISMQPNDSSSYIIGHYSETQRHFVFYRGEHGKQWSWPQDPNAQPTCVTQS